MTEYSDKQILSIARDVFADTKVFQEDRTKYIFGEEQCFRIASDGSTRRFWRVYEENVPICVIAAPQGTSENELAESRAAWRIGQHLFTKGIGVPEPYGWDSLSGTLLFEDLGDTRLHDIVVAEKNQVNTKELHVGSVTAYYQQSLEKLLAMQLQGVENFDSDWCWDTPRYDVKLMLEKESNYFLSAFWQGIRQEKVDAEAREELAAIAELAGSIPSSYFLHRDFQCRNIMIKNGTVRFIDYQGGRFGPLAYDVASLLIDPYSALPSIVQSQLLEFYFDRLRLYLSIDRESFMKQYALLALQRNLQIVGAFSYLYTNRKKKFFKAFIHPALVSLHFRLHDPVFSDYPKTRKMVESSLKDFVLE
ncbi:MAG: aminoglycoside phosphotransferase family protein [Desulforhopalus sp.]